MTPDLALRGRPDRFVFLLVIAAFGGFFLASYHLRKVPGPRAVVLIHAGVAVVGFVLLAGGAFRLF